MISDKDPNLLISKSFHVEPKNTFEQYSQIYHQRLNFFKPILQEIATKTKKHPLKEISKLKNGEEVGIIGILYKSMKLQHTALKEIEKRLKLEKVVSMANYVSENDKLFLDDEHQRIEIRNVENPNELVSGVIVYAYGLYSDDGVFYVKELVYPGIETLMYPIAEKPVSASKILFLSNLGIGNEISCFPKLQLLANILTEVIPSKSSSALSGITHVIVAGNIFDQDYIWSVGDPLSKHATNSKNALSQIVSKIDNLFFQISMKAKVIMMPGYFDPASYFYPQQPFHPSFFPNSSTLSSFHFSTNPLSCRISGYEILGTSGNNIKAIQEYSTQDDPVKIMEFNLVTNLISPNTPENYGCYQFSEMDPFIIKSKPRVYFAGSCGMFSSKSIKVSEHQPSDLNCIDNQQDHILLLAVPNFKDTHECVVLDTCDFTPKLVHIG